MMEEAENHEKPQGRLPGLPISGEHPCATFEFGKTKVSTSKSLDRYDRLERLER